MKNKALTIILIVLLSILILFLSIFTYLLLVKKINYNIFKYKENKMVINEVYEQNFDKIKIDSNAADIDIKTYNEEDVKLVVYQNENKTKINTDNNILYIKSETKSCVGICVTNRVSKIELYLPSNYDKDIVINTNYGDIDVENLKEATLKIEADAGDVEVDTIKNVEINSNYGDIEINEVTNYLKLSTNAGDIDIDKLNINEDSTIKNNFGDIQIGNTNEIYIDAEVDFGSVKIDNNYRDSKITLRIENNMGSIKVRN